MDSTSSSSSQVSSPSPSSPPSPTSPTSSTTPHKPPEPPSSTPNLYALVSTHLSHTTSRTNSTLTRLSTLLSRTSTLDTTLLTLSYTLQLLHGLLTHPSSSPSTKTTFPNPLRAFFPSLHNLTPSIPPLTQLLSTLRTHLRLLSLLPIYLSVLHAPTPRTPLLRLLSYTQLATTATFQILENIAVLADAGVIRAQPRERVQRWWLWSSRAWMAGTGVELVKLGVQGKEIWSDSNRRRKEMGELSSLLPHKTNEEKPEREKAPSNTSALIARTKTRLKQLEQEEQTAQQRWCDWKCAVGIQMAYAPMTVHYSLREGFLGEAGIGALGVLVGWLSFGRAWREVG